MLKRTFTIFLVAAILNLGFSCTRTVRYDYGKLPESKEKIVRLSLIDGTTVDFDDQGGTHLQEAGVISGFEEVERDTVIRRGRVQIDKHTVHRNIPTDSVLQVWVQRSNPIGTFFAVIAVAAAVALVLVLIVAATKESCPFIYSFDGERFVFDAEPLGGAICQGLQRTEWSRLEHIKAVDGQYRLRIRNEVPEIQYLDEMKLLVVDHSPDQIIVPDAAGTLHAVSEITHAQRAVDEKGRNILPFVSGRDGSAWQTHMIESELRDTDDTRHHLTFSFPKPGGAKAARLIVNTGTALWGSHMIREMLEMRGSQVDDWYTDVNRNGRAMWELAFFNLREELYIMKVYVENGDSLVQRGFVHGSGPLIAEDRVVEIDVSDIAGDELTLQLNPPKGFWTIDYVAVEYDNDREVAPVVVHPISAINDAGRDVLSALDNIDNTYYVMPEIGDWSEIVFDAPRPATADLQRSIFLSTSGYYEVKIDKTQEPQIALLERGLNEPGAVQEYAIERFIKWQANGPYPDWDRQMPWERAPVKE